MQASPNLNFDSEHNFDSDTVLLIDECRRVIKTNFRGGPAQRWARTTIAAGHVLKWLKRASPGDLRAIRVKGVRVEDDHPGGELYLIFDMFTSVMTCYAVKWMEKPNRERTGWAFDEEPETRHKICEMLSKCAELGCGDVNLILARMYFECNNKALRRSLETCGVNPATALEYLLEAADVNNDCEAHVLLGKLHLQGPEGQQRPTDLPAGVKSPVPFNAEKSLDHFKKAIESYDALAEPKVLETGFVPEHILLNFSREGVLMNGIFVIGTMYMFERMFTRNFPHDPKRSMNIFKWAASKGCLPSIAVLGGANPKCAHCGGNNPSKHCPGCLCTKYCSKKCQRKHWGHHKGKCKTALLDACQVF